MRGKRVTIRDLVDQTGCSSATIVKMRDHIGECRVQSLAKVAKVLNIEIYEFFFDAFKKK